jgi:hypothetical protein
MASDMPVLVNTLADFSVTPSLLLTSSTTLLLYFHELLTGQFFPMAVHMLLNIFRV